MARSHAQTRLFLVFFLILAAGAAIGVWRWRLQPSPAELVLTPVGYDALEGWTTTDARAALAAFRRSCAGLAALPEAGRLGGAGYAGTRADWDAVCAAAAKTGSTASAARNYFEALFAPVAVTEGDRTDALFTGYYEPEIRASRRPHAAYAIPLYGLPPDLVTADLGLFRRDLAGRHISGRLDGHALVPYPTRAEIDAHGPAGAAVLVYAADPVSLFFLQLQGSGRARLDDGSLVRLAYAGQNGRPYTPIGRILLRGGKLDRDHMSMQAIAAWLRGNPTQARHVMESDASYVFFRELPIGDSTLGSPGTQGLPLTPQASLAVDATVHPLGVPFFVATVAPAPDPALPQRRFDRVMVAQDTGGAIRGAARGDIFWGAGAGATAVAGRMKSRGRFYVLLPRPLARILAPYTEYPVAAR